MAGMNKGPVTGWPTTHQLVPLTDIMQCSGKPKKTQNKVKQSEEALGKDHLTPTAHRDCPKIIGRFCL